MAIIGAEIKEYKAAVNVDGSTNGGRMTSNEIISGVRNAVFPNVSQAARTAGVTRWRKIFSKVANDDDLTLENTKIHLTNISSAEDYISIAEGDHDDTYADLSSPQEYGAGELASNVSAGGTEIVVTLEDASMLIFDTVSATNVIWISDGVNEEYFENVAASKTDDEVTLTLDSGDTLANDYTTANGTIVASCIDVGDLEASSESWTETSSAGTYDETTYPLVLDNIGTVYDTWTLTFTSATTFSVVGANEGSVGSGNISTGFAPSNPDFTKPYFTLAAAGWGGTWATNDTITFTTNPAAQGIWIKQVVPAGAASYSGDSWTIRTAGESA
jgi:hypothetical protein